VPSDPVLPGSVRDVVADARRIVVKVGSSSLTTAEGGIDPARVRRLVDTVAAVRVRGADVVLVSSGAIAAGLAPLGLARRPAQLAAQQAAASVGQGLLVHRYTEELARHGVIAGQVLLTLDDVTRRAHYRNASRTFTKLLELGVLPIVNENDTVATTEIRFGDNDRLAALVAHLVHADLLLLLSDVDGLYDADPALPDSALVPDVVSLADLDGVRVGSAGAAGLGTGGMHTKLEAARIATGAGIPVVLTAAEHATPALAGERVGTLFHATGRRRPTRLLWLAHATEPKGTILLDAGAVRAIVERRASLLAAGVTGVRGSFAAGDPVDLAGPDDRVVARGLVNFDAEEVPSLVGRSTRELKADLGAAYEREVVHRDDLIVL
jgi:glutamate 5-kinase